MLGRTDPKPTTPASAYDPTESGCRPYTLCRYVTGATPNSLRAGSELRDVLERYVPGTYRLEIVDLYQRRERAREALLVAALTLIKELPLPMRRLVSDMSRENRAFRELGLRGGNQEPPCQS